MRGCNLFSNAARAEIYFICRCKLGSLQAMKLLFLVTVSLVTSIASSNAGPTEKEMPGPPPCPSWYADSEWNISLWAGYAFIENRYPGPSETISFGPTLPKTSGPSRDRYLEADHAWGGGVDAKYFFKRYFGVGLQGFGFDARRSFGTATVLPQLPGFVGSRVEFGAGHEERVVGGILGTFTLRYPIGCSRVAPYVWLGGGLIFGGGEQETLIANDIPAGVFFTHSSSGPVTKPLGQFGGGFEVRLTPRLGLINDFSWNVINGGENNFGMARTGINFAF